MQTDAVDLTPDGHPDRPTFLNNIGNSFLTRLEHFGEPSDLEQAILRHEVAIELIPDGHPHKSRILNSHGNTFLKRFGLIGSRVISSKQFRGTRRLLTSPLMVAPTN